MKDKMKDKVKNKGIIITQTPFRVSFFGGGTDFSDYFNEHGGSVIGTTINKYLYVAINSLERISDKKIRLSYSKLEQVNHIDEIQHSQVREIIKSNPLFDDGNFLDIHTFADLPASSGMGSSSSFTVGMLNNLYLMNHIYKTPESLSTEAINIERNILKDQGGWQDQIIVAYGGFNRINFFNDSFSVTPLVLSLEKLHALEASCMLFFTNKLRSSNDMQDKLIKSDNSNRIKCLHEIKEHVEQAHRILNKSTSPQKMVQDFGLLLGKTWETKKKLNEGISSEHIDQMFQIGMGAGAYGGKLCGAGGGGFILFIVAEHKQAAVAKALKDYHITKTCFENYGSRPIYSKMITN